MNKTTCKRVPLESSVDHSLSQEARTVGSRRGVGHGHHRGRVCGRWRVRTLCSRASIPEQQSFKLIEEEGKNVNEGEDGMEATVTDDLEVMPPESQSRPRQESVGRAYQI